MKTPSRDRQAVYLVERLAGCAASVEFDCKVLEIMIF